MLIFSFCLLFAGPVFYTIVGFGVSFGSSLLEDTISIAGGAVLTKMSIAAAAVIAGYLDGSAVIRNITCFPLDNIEVLKKTNKKRVIMADTVVKNKPKRTKMKIYRMYRDKDTLCQLWESAIRGKTHIFRQRNP